MDVLLQKVPKSELPIVLNRLDESGTTSLMKAANAGFNDYQRQYRMIEKLLMLGADKDIVDVLGETALGKFFHREIGRNQYAKSSQEQLWAVRTERLLRPVDGPTTADLAYRELLSADDDDMVDSLVNDW